MTKYNHAVAIDAFQETSNLKFHVTHNNPQNLKFQKKCNSSLGSGVWGCLVITCSKVWLFVIPQYHHR